jgi:hypothetical protein
MGRALSRATSSKCIVVTSDPEWLSRSPPGIRPRAPISLDLWVHLLLEGIPTPFHVCRGPGPPVHGRGPHGIAQAWCARLFRWSNGPFKVLWGSWCFYHAVMMALARAWWFRSSGAQVVSIALTAAARLGLGPGCSISLASFYKIYGSE